MEPPETIAVETDEIACDGGNAALGHPRVFLHLGPDGTIVCPYCGRRFVRRAPAEAAGTP